MSSRSPGQARIRYRAPGSVPTLNYEDYNRAMTVEFRNYSAHSRAEIEWLEREVGGHRSIVDGMELARRFRGEYVVPTVVAQDEYSHDASLELREDLYVVYGMT